MAEQPKNDRVVKLLNVRLSFPVLFEAKAFDDKGKKMFSGSFIMPPEHPAVAEIRTAITATGVEKWGADASKILNQLFLNDKMCLHDGNKKDYEGLEGNLYVTANNQVRPLVLDRNRAQLSASDGRPYAGCYVNATISLWAQDNKFGKRINANLRGVQFHADGDAFAGGGTASVDEFEDTGGAPADPAAFGSATAAMFS